MKSVLLVEDSKEVYVMVKQALGSSLELHWASNLEEARKKFSKQFSLVLLDVELPDGNGFDLCTEFLAISPDLAIFFLSSHDALSDKVLGFSAGADDYIVKPFAALELKARVDAKIKKLDIQKMASDLLQWPEIIIDKNKQEVSILIEESFQNIKLTALEFKILHYLAQHIDVVVPREQVLNEIWGEDVHIYPRSVDTHVSKLRKKLGPVSHIINSVHGTGYRFSPSN